MTKHPKLPLLAGISVWRQIADDLAQHIDQGVWKEREKLPSEQELALHYGVNRHTLRRALQELASVGKVRILHGRGTFVAGTVFDYQLRERPRFSEWVKSYKDPGSRELLDAAIRPLRELPEYPRVQTYSVFPDYPRVAVIHILSLLGKEPISLARHLFFGEALLPLVQDLGAGLGISESLHKRGIKDYTRLRSTITGTLPDPKERQLLGIEPGDSVLLCENVNIDQNGIGIEFSTVLYPASRVRLVYEPD